MATLELTLTAETLKSARTLALLHYGDAEGSSLGRVIEAAILMRLLWLDLLEAAGQEVGEPVAEWGTEGHETPGQAVPEVREWLFGGR